MEKSNKELIYEMRLLTQELKVQTAVLDHACKELNKKDTMIRAQAEKIKDLTWRLERQGRSE